MTAPFRLRQLPVLSEQLMRYSPRVVINPRQPGFDSQRKSIYPAYNGVNYLENSLKFNGGAGYVDLGSGPLVNDAQSHSVIWVSRLAVFSNAYPVVAHYNAGGSRVAAFYSNAAGYNDITFGVTGAGGTVLLDLSRFGPVVGTTHAVAIRRTGPAATSNFAYVNGVAMPQVTANSAGIFSGNSVLGQTDTSNAGNAFSGLIGVFVLFDGLLPDALLQLLSARPDLLFAKRQRYLPIAPIVNLLPVLSNPSFTGITAVGATPRVDYTY